MDYALHLLMKMCSRLTTAAFEIGAALVFGSSLVIMLRELYKVATYCRAPEQRSRTDSLALMRTKEHDQRTTAQQQAALTRPSASACRGDCWLGAGSEADDAPGCRGSTPGQLEEQQPIP